MSLEPLFDAIYGADLVFVKDCWKLCGDAHCCSFQRYKSRYRIIAQEPFQELPLLPGEWAYLQSRGWSGQFAPFELRTQGFQVGGRAFHYQAIISRRPGCACDHATRPTICRLYPLMPRFDVEGHLVGTETVGLYEELERMEGLTPACALQALPFAQMNAFLTITASLARSPWLRFHLEAYRLTKHHVAQGLQERMSSTGKSAFAAFEGAFLRQRLIDQPVLQAQLQALASGFDARWPGWDNQGQEVSP